MACLAVEENLTGGCGGRVLVDVHNTLVTNALLRWGTPAQWPLLPQAGTAILLGRMPSRKRAQAVDAFASDRGPRWTRSLRAEWAQALDQQWT